MRILSATEAISPAFSRTKLILFTPFRMGRSWKLAATAYLSFAGTAFFPFPLLYLCAVPIIAHSMGRGAAIAIVSVSVALTAIFLGLFLLFSRLQFAFFDIVLNRGEFVAPAWRKYGAVSFPWTMIKLALGILLSVLVAVPAVPLFRIFMESLSKLPDQMKSLQPGQFPDQMFDVMASSYVAYFVVMAVAGLYLLVMSTASAFLVPSMALESMSPPAAAGRFVRFVRKDTANFLAFVGMRMLMGIAGYFALMISYQVVLLMAMVVFGLLGTLVGLLLHAVGVPYTVLFPLGIGCFFVFVFLLNGYVLFFAMGTYFTFFEAHTLYFLGGRYPLLGDLLERSTPPPADPSLEMHGYAPPPGYPDPAAPEPPSES